MNQIDIVIPIAPQDFHSLEFTYPFIKKAYPEGRIVVIANAQIEKQVSKLNNVLFLDEPERLLQNHNLHQIPLPK